jgi:adenylate cyclase
MQDQRIGLGSVLRETFTTPRKMALPAHVLEAVRRQDRSSEVLIKVLQLFVLALFGLLYFASPRTDAGTAFTPVPYVLALYLALTLFGLAWVLSRELPNWAVDASILFDVGLLLALIWSFHIQYGQPASFYLKVPTFLYVFIFIALRALRFQSRFVLVAGLVAMGGWAAMVAYVVVADARSTMVTRNYVEYLTSNSLLVGAEIDKIVSILIVTLILWIVLRRARTLLLTAVQEGFAAQSLSRYFDEPVASQIRGVTDTKAFAEGTKRDAAVLFVDIRNFTKLTARLEPGEVIAIVAEYLARVVPRIQAHGGTIDKFLGDGIMATFGAATESGTYAADALRAVDDIMDDAATWPGNSTLGRLQSPPIGAAVAAGPVIFGTVGAGRRLEVTVIGATVNLAAKLEKHNKAVGCRALTTRNTLDTALAQGYRPKARPEDVTSMVTEGEEALPLALLHA